MTSDQQTYQRGINTALLGLAVQAAFILALAGLALYTRSSALTAATWYVLGGLPIWATLWIVYQQHKRERVEALEAEQLAQADAQTAAIFEEAGHQLATARRGLDRLYKWGLPLVSIGIAVYLIALGSVLFFQSYNRISRVEDEPANYDNLFAAAAPQPDANAWVLIGLCLLLAFIGFLTARYIAGMTLVPAWQMLRAGAAYLIGNVVVVILLLVAAAFDAGDTLWPFATLSLLIPALMVLLGIETAIALLLGVYRPRKADEVVRPAFDSRLLGWLTRPESLGKIVSETLNYQFGFEITRSWFYVLLAKALAPLIAIGFLLLLVMTCIVIVSPYQQAVVTRSGELTRIAEPGLSFKWPWPIGKVEKYTVGRTEQLVIGTYAESQRIEGKATLWTNEHVTGEMTYLVTAPVQINDPGFRQQLDEQTAEDDPETGQPSATLGTRSSLGGLIALECVVSYQIGDLETFVSQSGAQRPRVMLEALAEQTLNAVVASRSVDDLLGPGRIEVGEQLLAELQEVAEPIGFKITNVLLYDIHPPNEGEVATAYLQQVDALQTQKTAVENARKDAVATLSAAAGSQAEALRIAERIEATSDPRSPEEVREIQRLIDEAGGQAAQRLAQAREQRWRIALNERAEGTRFAFELAAFNKAPQYFMARYYLDMIAEVWPQASRRVISTVRTDTPGIIRLNLEDETSAGAVFRD
jgi:membrane protease subunit HflK